MDGTTDFSPVRVVEFLSGSTRVFPNPNDGDFTVFTDVAQTFTLHTLDGRLLRKYAHSGGGAQVQREDLVPGLYWLRFGGTGEVVKVVVR